MHKILAILSFLFIPYCTFAQQTTNKPRTNVQQNTQLDSIFHAPEAYFNKALAQSDAFLAFIRKALQDKEVAHQTDILWEEKRETGEKMKNMYKRDLTRCLLEMGHEPTNYHNLEHLPVALCSAHDFYGERDRGMRLKFSDLNRISGFIRLEEKNTSYDVKRIEIYGADGRSFVADLLLNSNRPDLCHEYFKILHDFFTFVANADGKVLAKERNWLNVLKWKSEEPEYAINAIASTDNPMMKLDEMVGLESVKEKVRTLANVVRIQKLKEARGLKTQPLSYHCLFLGNPGTGKTSVARILAGIYRDLGVIKKGHLVETDRSGLVAGYTGQTAPKTNHLCDSALNGVLFIDEAYSLAQGGDQDFGKEAIATLLKRMEDDRDRLVVILAGYTKEMTEFLESNSGLKSRFNNYIDFPDYTSAELYKIFELNLKNNDCTISPEGAKIAKAYIERAVKNKDQYFGNARFVRNFFEKVFGEAANRLVRIKGKISDDTLKRIEATDINNAIKKMNNQ